MQENRLMRSTGDRKIGGVAGGMAEYFGVDATLVRVAWVVAILSGFGVLAYIILWIVLPEGSAGARGRSSAIAIVEERFARGEIGADELHRMRQDLEGT